MRRKANIIFSQILGFGLFFIFLFLFLLTALTDKVNYIFSKLGAGLETICGCPDHFSFLNHPLLFISLILVGIGLFAFLTYALFKVISLKHSTDKFISDSTKKRKMYISKKLRRIADSLGLGGRVIEINDKTPLIFCYGLIRPKICISPIFIKRLTDDELSAVLLHEQHHLKTKEPIKQFIIKAITRILFFVPGLNLMAKKYYTYAELAADEWTIDRAKSKIPLAKAVYKILGWNEKMIIKKSLAIPHFSNITEERIKKIVDDKYVINIKILTPKLLLGISIFLFFIVSFGAFIYSSNVVIASHANSICAPGEPADYPPLDSSINQSLCSEDCLHSPVEGQSCSMRHNSENLSCGG